MGSCFPEIGVTRPHIVPRGHDRVGYSLTDTERLILVSCYLIIKKATDVMFHLHNIVLPILRALFQVMVPMMSWVDEVKVCNGAASLHRYAGSSI